MLTDKPTDVDVRFEDQEKINEFGKLNNRLLELRADKKQLITDIEKLDDANTELMMSSSNGSAKVMILIGEAFVAVDEEYATEYCEKKQQALQDKREAYTQEENTIVIQQERLKKELYGRFGDTINLEN